MEYLEPLTLPDYWPHGVRYPDVEAPIFVHWAAPNTVILRQSKMTSYEAPFLYLLFGQERAILFDTGAVADAAVFPLRATVDRLMTQWLAQYPRTRVYELVVAHTHAHGDHVAGDVQFGDRMNTVVVDHAPEAVASFFDIATWPGGEGRYDLGGRVLRILPIPGHHPASIAIYDPPSGALFTGDTVYPGRIYVADVPAFSASIDRLAQLADEVPIAMVLGGHVEMTSRPRKDYPIGCTYQPEERPLEMAPNRLQAVRKAVRSGRRRYVGDDFILYRGLSLRTMAPLLLRGWIWRTTHAP